MNNFNSVEKLALRLSSTIVLIFSVIFAFYIHVFGETTPGGGFQAGAILSSGIIIYQNFNSIKVFSDKSLNTVTVIGVLIYIFAGFTSLLFGGSLFEYESFHPIYGHVIGAIAIETGVFLVVGTSMVRIANTIQDY
jgi:multicomponent Na+:H+ antiporter subunit B